MSLFGGATLAFFRKRLAVRSWLAHDRNLTCDVR